MSSVGSLTHREAEVIALWAKGHSGAQIATQLGNTSRCSVIGLAKRLRDEGDPAFLQAEALRPKLPNRTAQVAEWMAEHDGRWSDCARDLAMPYNSVLSAWERVKKAMGAQAR